jgi:magnesium chelatase subunit I
MVIAALQELKLTISDICSRLNVDGLRGDIVTNRACKALVAFEGRKEVTLKDVERVISLCLNHR